MQHREAKATADFPPLSDTELTRFAYEFANLQYRSVTLYKGEIMDNRDASSMYGRSYLLGWSWEPYMLIEVVKKRIHPEPDFVAFVRDMSVRLGLIPYDVNDPNSKLEFEAAMKGRCSLTKTTGEDSRYAFGTQIAYEAWCKAHNRGIPT